jgi:hypothetical protein
LLLLREVIEERDHIVGLRAVAGVLLDGVDQSTVRGPRAPIVQKEDSLPQTPQRRSTEFVRPLLCAKRKISWVG